MNGNQSKTFLNLGLLPVLMLGLIGGVLVGAGGFWFLGNDSAIESTGEKEPLYWVAPMDANYRRDGPGKSPMGMDLVPVYEEANGQDVGTVSISPRVVSNLGVRTQTATKMDLHTQIKTVGYIQYDEDKLVHIHPRISGWVEKLYVKAEGDPVTKNQPIYDIYSPELVNAQEELLLALERKNQRLTRAAKDRLLALQVDQSTVDALEKSRTVTQTITINSPQDGIVDNLNVREGFYVKPDTTMMQIGALDEVWVQGEIFERQAGLVKIGVPVTMTLNYLPGREWQGKVDYVYPTLDAKTRTVKVRMRFKNQERVLKPNMFAQLTIHSDSGEPTLLIPKEALIRTANLDRVVLALGNGNFKSVPVTVGRMDTHNVEIIKGINEGDEVVTSAQFLLDSESNITAELMRMEEGSGDSMKNMTMPETNKTQEKNSNDVVLVEASINDIMIDHRTLNVTHQPIPEWDWPVMTMNFNVVEGVDLETLQVGAKVQMEITGNPTEKYFVTNIHSADTTSKNDSDDSMRESSMQHDAH